ncbi:MAG: glycosyltransferase family 4 protein [Bacteroidales bacterium]
MSTLLQINTVVNYGSTGRIAEDIGKTAMSNGWESYIAYGRYDRPSRSKLIRIGSDFDQKVHGLQTRLFDRHGLGSVAATRTFIEQVKRIKPGVIHLHNLHGYYLNIEILFGYLSASDIPVVWTMHDCWPVTGHCVYFDFVECHKWKTECGNCPQTKSYPASLVADRSRENFRLKKRLFASVKNMTLVPVSDWLAEIVRHSFLADFPVEIINNGIDTEVFKPVENRDLRAKYGLSDHFVILGVAGLWSPRKGLKDFIKLSQQLPDHTRIVLLGLDAHQLKNLPENITGIVKTESVRELAELYSMADVYVNPTWEDNFPTTNLESLACGTPVITYRTGGSVESVSEGTGLIVEKGDINGLLLAIERVRTKGKASYSANCVNRAKRYYRKEDRYNDYMELYQKIQP